MIGPSGAARRSGMGGGERRFTEATLDQLFEPYRDRVLRAELIPGGREKLYVLRALA